MPRFDLTNASGQPGGDDDRFAMGVCYYPEQWPQDRWPLYARQIRDLGIRFVRIGEFTWSLIEPSPGCFDWSWLDQAVESLASEDLAVVFGTPTSAPPAWLSNAHPEILRWDLDGRRQKHGSRRHVDLASPHLSPAGKADHFRNRPEIWRARGSGWMADRQ